MSLAARFRVFLFDEALAPNPGIALSVWWNVVLFALSAAALPFDHRHVLGINPWIKPIKFEVSVILFLVTLGWMITELGRGGQWLRSRRWLGWGFGICMIVENTIIALQSARGVRSHMNYTTLADGLLFAIMGVFIFINTGLVAWLLALWLRARPAIPRAVAWGTRLGLMMLLAGSIEGTRIVANMGHTVGAADGGPGLPFLNWSTLHGDLRIAHFFAIHALQIFPLAGVALSKTHLRVRVQLVLLVAFAAAFTAGVSWLFIEALRGQPLMH